MAKSYLIKERTLRLLQRKITVDPEFYDRKESESEILFKRKAISDYPPPEATGAGGSPHPWQVTDGGLNEEEEPTYNVAGGRVHTQGGAFSVGPATGLINIGFIVLKITRHASTREITAAVIESFPTAAVYVSTATNQYIKLADLSSGILQLRFQNIYVFEQMVVSNGVFQLVPLEMSGPNPYNIP